eukprot:Lankesteria_metandrocarpae@DN1369_c0_g1_i1.p1
MNAQEHQPLNVPDAFYDPESQTPLDDDHSKEHWRKIQHGFIRKVYGILSVQLLFTCALGAYFTLSTVAQTWIFAHAWLPITCSIVAIVLMIALACSSTLAQRVPINYILLTIFTGCEAVFVGYACAKAAKTTGGEVVLQAFVATAIITIALTIFAFQTKYDFTSSFAILFYVSIAGMIFAIFSLFFKSPWVQGLVSAIFALIMCAHIVYDTQLMIGNGKIKASVDDYVLCVMCLYVDIINLFMYLLRLLQLMNR